MKRCHLLICIAIVVLCCLACGETTLDKKPVCIVSTAAGSSSEANWYEGNSFNFNYDELPILTSSDSDTLLFSVNWDTNKLIVGEDYYAYPSNESGICYRETYEIQKNDDGLLTMEIKRRNNIRDEQAVFYILNDKGKFVIKILLPVAESKSESNL